jgi:hypothetical protein
MALSAHRRELAHMEAVFKQYKDVDGGLSKAALIAALKHVDAPVLSSSDGASEDSLFRRADTNLSGAVDQNEYIFSQPTFFPFSSHLRHVQVHARGKLARRPRNVPRRSQPERERCSCTLIATLMSFTLLCSLLHRRSVPMRPAEPTSWAA